MADQQDSGEEVTSGSPFLKVLFLVIALAIFVLGTYNYVHENPQIGNGPPSPETLPGKPVHTARTTHAVALARRYWAARGHHKDCPGGIKTVFGNYKQLPEKHVVADSTEYGCAIRYGESAYYAASWREFCEVTIHEFGHLVGMNHSHNPRSIMYPKVTNVLVVPPECKSRYDASRYRTPIHNMAASCRFLIDSRLVGWGYGHVHDCGMFTIEYVSHETIARSRPSSCVDVEHVRPLPPEYIFDGGISATLTNPRKCRHLRVDIVAAGSPTTKNVSARPIYFKEGHRYNRPYLEE